MDREEGAMSTSGSPKMATMATPLVQGTKELQKLQDRGNRGPMHCKNSGEQLTYTPSPKIKRTKGPGAKGMEKDRKGRDKAEPAKPDFL